MLGGWDWDFWTHHQQVLPLNWVQLWHQCPANIARIRAPSRERGWRWVVCSKTMTLLERHADRVGISKKQGALTKCPWTFWVMEKKDGKKRDTKQKNITRSQNLQEDDRKFYREARESIQAAILPFIPNHRIIWEDWKCGTPFPWKSVGSPMFFVEAFLLMSWIKTPPSLSR